MSAVTLPSEARGRAALSFVHIDGETRLAGLYQHDPLRVLFPPPADGEAPCAAIVTTSGGLVGGDVVEIEVSTGPGARAGDAPGGGEGLPFRRRRLPHRRRARCRRGRLA